MGVKRSHCQALNYEEIVFLDLWCMEACCRNLQNNTGNLFKGNLCSTLFGKRVLMHLCVCRYWWRVQERAGESGAAAVGSEEPDGEGDRRLQSHVSRSPTVFQSKSGIHPVSFVQMSAGIDPCVSLSQAYMKIYQGEELPHPKSMLQVHTCRKYCFDPILRLTAWIIHREVQSQNALWWALLNHLIFPSHWVFF